MCETVTETVILSSMLSKFPGTESNERCREWLDEIYGVFLMIDLF